MQLLGKIFNSLTRNCNLSTYLSFANCLFVSFNIIANGSIIHHYFLHQAIFNNFQPNNFNCYDTKTGFKLKQLTDYSQWDPLATLSINNKNSFYIFYVQVRRCNNKCGVNWSSDRVKPLKFEAEGQEFAKNLRSIKQFLQTVKGQNNFW